ncbi:MAG: hypothetical protein LR015_10870 [Verrucomicrobia bacterium]|nr:hypothetical protein [Verrucomicrobiota bacterium]
MPNRSDSRRRRRRGRKPRPLAVSENAALILPEPTLEKLKTPQPQAKREARTLTQARNPQVTEASKQPPVANRPARAAEKAAPGKPAPARKAAAKKGCPKKKPS